MRECLRDRTDVLLLERKRWAILAALPRVRAILLVHDEPRYALPDTQRRLLARLFSAERLVAEVGRLLG